MTKKILILMMFLTGAAMAQKDKPKQDVVILSGSAMTSTISALRVPPQADYTEKITKDGHYLVTFDDPNNEYRCNVTAVNQQNRWEIGGFTVVCSRPHHVQDEREVKP